jgi:hypothetical protein
MLDYAAKAATAWFVGFFPLFEIYLAVPAAVAMGLDYVSAGSLARLGQLLAGPPDRGFLRTGPNWVRGDLRSYELSRERATEHGRALYELMMLH